MRTQKRVTLSNWIEYFLFRGFEVLMGCFSLETTYKAGEFIGRLAFRFNRELHRVPLDNLRRAYGNQLTERQRLDRLSEIFERNGANFLTALRAPFLNDRELAQYVTFEGLDLFLEQSNNQGVVLVLPHMGNWELLAQGMFLIRKDLNLGTHYRPLNNILIDQVVQKRRRRRGLQLFSKHDSTLRLTSFVRNQGLLAILADQRVGPRGAAGLFFGRPTTLSPLPYLVAKRANAPLISIHCETTRCCQWKIVFRVIDQKTAQACANALEESWRQSPSDVFWFEDRWRLPKRQGLDFLLKYSSNHQATEPLRLVFLGVEAPVLNLPGGLLTIESLPYDRHLPLKETQILLTEISDRGQKPVDIFCCQPELVTKLQRCSRKTLVICPDELPSHASERSPISL